MHRVPLTLICLAGLLSAFTALPARAGEQSNPPANDYPTVARVEYVSECMASHGGAYANLFKCSCAIDLIAGRLTYDDYTEASTYARNTSIVGGERGAVLRERGKDAVKHYLSVENDAQRTCGIVATAH